MPLITISHNRGSNGKAIARELARELDMRLYDDARLQQVAMDMGVGHDDLKHLNEKAPGLFDRILNRRPELYLELMDAVIYEVARRDQGIIIGHGSQMLLRDFGCALHVRIHAPAETRVANLMDRLGLARQTAERLVEKNDQRQKAFMRFAFELDWEDESLFDLSINTRKLAVESAVRLIVAASGLDEMTTCSLTALDAMERLSQQKKVQAALMDSDIDTRSLNIEVRRKGTVTITGLADSDETCLSIQQVASQVPGIQSVDLDVLVMNVPFY